MKRITLLSFIVHFTFLSSQVIYNTTQTVTTRNFTQDVHIKNGATVKFTGTFKFAKNVRVYVENTSQIILDNAIFERLNSSDRWFGIEMQGYGVKPCTTHNSSAVLLNSTVKGSLWGIVNSKVGSGQEVGALVHIENCLFDNSSNVTLYNEVIHCGLNAQIVGSTFIMGNDYDQAYKSITLFNNKKIIKNNIFKNVSQRQIGVSIQCVNSVGEISNNQFNIAPQNWNNAHRSIAVYDVQNFYKEQISYAFPWLKITGNTFGNCGVDGFVINSLNPNKFLYVEDNVFNPGNQVKIEGSVSNGGLSNNYIDNTPVWIKDIGTNGGFGFHGNTVKNSRIEASGVVSGTIGITKTGQQFTCNKFEGDGWIYVRSTSTGLPDQGYRINFVTYSNKNEFSTAAFDNIWNAKFNAPNFKYYFYGVNNCSNPLYPCNVIRVDRLATSRPNGDMCIRPGMPIFSLAPPSDNGLTNNEKTSLLTAFSRLSQKITRLNSEFIDPCYYENIKDNYNKILLAPSDLFDAKLQISYLDNKLNYYGGLTASSEEYPTKDLSLSTYMNIKMGIHSELEKDLYARLDVDSTISNDSIVAMYRTIPCPLSEFKIAEVFLKKNQYDDALSILSNMKNLYTLDSLDSLESVKQVELVTLDKSLRLSNKIYSDMSLTEIDKLRSIAEFKGTRAGNSACFILGSVFGECSPENALYNEQNVTVAPEISISPNPSRERTLIQISNTSNSDNKYSVKIFDNSGNQVFEQNLMGIELENIDLDISGWKDGYYFVSLFVNDAFFTSKTLQKN